MNTRVMPRSQRILFVCAGNICRSPMAEAFMRQLIRERPGLRHVEVLSAGTIATDGNGPLGQTVRVMRADHGIDLTGHRSRHLSPNLRADLVLAMDRRVAAEAREMDTGGALHLIGDYAGYPGEEVDDPYGGSLDDHRACASKVKRLVDAVADRLERPPAAGDADA